MYNFALRCAVKKLLTHSHCPVSDRLKVVKDFCKPSHQYTLHYKQTCWNNTAFYTLTRQHQKNQLRKKQNYFIYSMHWNT